MQTISFYFFILLMVMVSMGFWKGFDNSFDLVKSSILKIAGGIFIILSSVFLLSRNAGKDTYSGSTYNKALDLPILFFIFSAILSTIFSANIYLSIYGNYETQIGLITYIYCAAIYFLIPAIIINDKFFRQSFFVIEILALVIAVFSIVEYFGINPFNLKPSDFQRPVTPVGHPVFSAGFMILILPYSALNIAGKKSFVLKYIVPLIILSGIVATQTRSAYVALLIQMIIFSAVLPLAFKSGNPDYRKYIRFPIYIFSGIIIVIILFSVLLPENPFVKRFLSIGAITNLPRWYLWKDSLGMFLHYPLTGTGISAFSNVFEYFESYQLRFAEIKGFFVNPHSNYLNILCTMGLIGAIAYLLILFQVLRVSMKEALSAITKSKSRNFFFAAIVSVTGYAVFGIADFDDVTILLYFFVLLSLIKIKHTQTSGNDTAEIQKVSPKIKLILGMVLILFSLYNIFDALIDMNAQNIFSQSKEKLNTGNLNGYIEGLNNAINLRPNESNFRYNLSYNILVYCSEMKEDQKETKKRLLERAKEEVIIAEQNYRSRLECLGLRSLIEFELGNEQGALKLKDEIFKTDTTQFQYRANLAVYYLNRNNYIAAIYEINSILNWDIKNTRVMILKVHYLEEAGQIGEAISLCRKIIEIEPGNRIAKDALDRFLKTLTK